MPPAKLSEMVKLILENAKLQLGDAEFTKEEAEVIWGGSKAAKVSELTDTQLLQFALINAHNNVAVLLAELETFKAAKQPNRQARRLSR